MEPLRLRVIKHLPECSCRGDCGVTSWVGLLPDPPGGSGVCAFSISILENSTGEGRFMRWTTVVEHPGNNEGCEEKEGREKRDV